jgi:hypothetical protein
MRIRTTFRRPITEAARPDASRSRSRRRFAPQAESLEIHVCLSHVGGLPAPSVPTPPAEIKLPLAEDSQSGGIKDQQNIQLVASGE